MAAPIQPSLPVHWNGLPQGLSSPGQRSAIPRIEPNRRTPQPEPGGLYSGDSPDSRSDLRHLEQRRARVDRGSTGPQPGSVEMAEAIFARAAETEEAARAGMGQLGAAFVAQAPHGPKPRPQTEPVFNPTRRDLWVAHPY